MTTENQEAKPETPTPVDTGSSNKDANLWAMLCHLSALVGFVIPFGNIIAPLVIWTIKKDEFDLVNDQGKEAINFQISITINTPDFCGYRYTLTSYHWTVLVNHVGNCGDKRQ
jgi:uncharacterized Tic20 family protein